MSEKEIWAVEEYDKIHIGNIVELSFNAVNMDIINSNDNVAFVITKKSDECLTLVSYQQTFIMTMELQSKYIECIEIYKETKCIYINVDYMG